MVVFSKFSCREYCHPWTESCTGAMTGIGTNAVRQSFRIYVTVYVLAMLMKGRTPTPSDLKALILRVSQSTAFLTCHAFSYVMFLCLLRRVFGGFTLLTASYAPAFLASYVSILVERPSRRGLLALYVTNVASETLFRMAAWRGLVRPIRYGEIMIFVIAITGLMYKYKTSDKSKDAVFGLLRFVVGPWESKNVPVLEESRRQEEFPKKKARNILEKIFSTILYHMKKLGKHRTCPHPHSCVHYTFQGAAKLFSVGYGLQVCLRLLLQMKRIFQNPKTISRCLLHRDALRFGAFFGGFSGIYRLSSCVLRWMLDNNSKYHSIPAGVLAALTFGFFPDVTIALYLLWKWIEVMYSDGVEKGSLPRLPGFTILLYCASTAVLFHAALLEPHNLRPSYWKFLHRISGGWIVSMDRKPVDVFGLDSSASLAKVIQETGTNYHLYPLWPKK